MTCNEHACICRVQVLNDLKGFNIHPKYRFILLKNLNRFRKAVQDERFKYCKEF